MGQSTPIKSFARSCRDEFRQTVLQGAERLSRQDIRELADDLHEMARDKAAVEGRRPRRAPLKDDGQTIWL